MFSWRVLPLLFAFVLLKAPLLRGAEELDFFESRIRPVLVEHCYECHSSAAAKIQGGLVLDFRDGLRKGGESGPSIVLGKPYESLLYQAIRHESLEMPPKERLSDEVIADFEKWIRDGAVDPRDTPPTPTQAASDAWKIKLAQRRTWWSLQPLNSAKPPATDEAARSVDRYLRQRLAERGLSPAPSAAPEVLARRLSLVLTGLPPAPERVAKFAADWQTHPETAWRLLVEETLASPHFGERFARHWMDVVRYADTYGYEWDNPAKGSWEYRDYLTRAFNDDVGFDQLIQEQIAGDLLAEPRINEHLKIYENLIGPMFYHLGEHRHGTSLDFNGIHQEMVNNKIDAFSKAFLAMTVACARCHDHKLDAVSQADYYALAGVFMTPRWTTRVIDVEDRYLREIEELKALRQQIREKVAVLWQNQAKQLDAKNWQAWSHERAKEWEKASGDGLAQLMLKFVAASDADIASVWSKLAGEQRAIHDRQTQASGNRFQVLCDFHEPGFPSDWVVEGAGIQHGYVRHGEVLVSLEGSNLVQRLLPRGYHTHALSSKLPGAIRLPAQHKLPGNFLSLLVSGGEWASYLVVPQNAFQTESVTFLDAQSPAKWISIADNGLKNGVTRVCVELTTSSLNPNFPPRTDLARAGSVKLPPRDNGFNKRSWFSLTRVVAHDSPGAPEAMPVLDLFDGPPPTTISESWEQIASWISRAIDRWATGSATEEDVQTINWLLAQDRLVNSSDTSSELSRLVERYREVESRIGFARTVNSMDERSVDPIDYRLNVRGNVDEEGLAIHRNFLEVFATRCGVLDSPGSGRLELTKFLSDPENPQAARVYVNRVWQWIFGTGIVATASDFGKLGEQPSHPELLDWLTAEFIRQGWSTKRLVRQLVFSDAFQQDGGVGSDATERDPENRLLHHFSTRRLEAESIRDSLLAVSDCFDPRLYGPPIYPPRVAEDSQKRLFAGPLDGQGRRSMYLQMSIMEPPKFLVTFNLPDLKLPTGRRDVTNVPAQALALLNDPFVQHVAGQWADRLLKDDCESPEERVRRMFIRAYGRAADDDEVRRWASVVREIAGNSDAMRHQDAWKFVAHALFNSKEFIYYR